MLNLIRSKLSLKVSIALAIIVVPPMVIAATFITSHEAARQEELTVNSAKLATMTGAKMYAATLETGLDEGLYTLKDLFEPIYEDVKGFDFAGKPRFHTKYDFYTDRAVVGFQEEILKAAPDFLYAVGTDINGYIPTHNSKYARPLVNDPAQDLRGNRTKRKFDNTVELTASKNVEPVLVQHYFRDTGELAWDVSSPIYVKGRHFGGFRLGVSITSMTAHRRALLLELSTVFGFLGLVTIGFIFIMLRRSMKPLERLATTANAISTGEGLDTPIRPASRDEIGQMASSLNRLRASLQAAMERLDT